MKTVAERPYRGPHYTRRRACYVGPEPPLESWPAMLGRWCETILLYALVSIVWGCLFYAAAMGAQ